MQINSSVGIDYIEIHQHPFYLNQTTNENFAIYNIYIYFNLFILTFYIMKLISNSLVENRN